jgi:hypothetical protein
MMTLAVELSTFMTLKLEEDVGGKLQALHMLQCLCCILRCMIDGYRALPNFMFKRNIPNLFPAQVLSRLPIMGTQCEILNSHGGKMGCGSRNLLTFQRKPAVSIFFHLEGGFRMICLNITFLPSHPRILIFYGLLWSTVSMLKLTFDVLPCILGATDQTCLSNQEV